MGIWVQSSLIILGNTDSATNQRTDWPRNGHAFVFEGLMHQANKYERLCQGHSYLAVFTLKIGDSARLTFAAV